MGKLATSLRRMFRRSALPEIPPPGSAGSVLAGKVRVTSESALRASAVWAALRIRADLISTLPIDSYRMVDGVRVEVPLPRVTFTSGGHVLDWHEFLYSTQFDLDRSGNAFGIITDKNALGLPSRIELVPLSDVGVRLIDDTLTYVIGGETYRPDQVWHERQFTVSGLALGLSPIAYAAYSVGTYLSAQQFALEWFGNSATPAVELKNTQRVVPPDVAAEIKARYQASLTPGGVFVSGSDWELRPVNAANAQQQYVELLQFGVPDIARFFGVPADLIDGAISGHAVTYANITQRNLQFLVMNLGPAITRRERALKALQPEPRYIKLNRSALLAMDPETRARTLKLRLDSRVLAPSEARALDDLPPLTAEQIAEIERLYGTPRSTPTGATS